MAPPNRAQAGIPPEQREAAREQIIINTRLTALQAAQDIVKVNPIGAVGAEKLIDEARKIEAYILTDITSVKPRSGLVIQSQMPPPGEFKPGS